MSVNQLAVWKTTNNSEYPVQLIRNKPEGGMNNITLIPSTIRTWREDCKTKIAKESFTYNDAKIWNKAPQEKKLSDTESGKKSNCKIYSLVTLSSRLLVFSLVLY